MDKDRNQVPASPEEQPAGVREQLDQKFVTHQGEQLQPEPNQADEQKYMGATEDNVTPIMPPVRGPSDLVGDTDDDQDIVDPGNELTPG